VASSYAREIAYVANARAVGRRWRSYLGLIAVTAGAELVLWLAPPFRYKEFYAGWILGAVTILVALSIARFDDPQVRGHLGEQFSLEALRKVRGWLVVENLRFEHTDVDHIVVTPSGVLAVETKWHSRALPPADAARKRHDLAAARAATAKVRSFLRSKKLLDGTVVTPLLIIWGPGSPTLPDGYKVVDDVYVVDGNHPELWAHRFNAPLLSTERRAEVHEAFVAYLRQREEHLAANDERLRRRTWQAFRDGIREARTERSDLRRRRGFVQRRHAAARKSSSSSAAR
jgi:hypothetical protein